MFYYLRIVVAMYLKEGRKAEIAVSPGLSFVVTTCLIVTLVLGILPETLLVQVRTSVRSVVTTLAQK
jgi:NADH:ubiquinone oxidoreductase subunit 2 (subunit N)